MSPLATLRADAEEIARQLPGFTLNADVSEAVQPGAAGRKRAGSGEQFWQYRRYAQTDAADRIDWRRSARGDEYYVRETELETARSVLFWCDPGAGFDWSSAPTRQTKAMRAKVIMLALAGLLAKSGERVGLLNGQRGASVGRHAADRLAEDLIDAASTTLIAPKAKALTIIASDFYDPITEWRARLLPLAERSRSGVLFVVSDPIEHEFPFSGRTKFHRPGSGLDRIFGRAETLRETYLEKLSLHNRELHKLAGQMGWTLVAHRTDQKPVEGAAALKQALETFGAKL